MHFTFKLARRLALLGGVAAGCAGVLSCEDDPASPASADRDDVPAITSNLTQATAVLVGAGNIAQCNSDPVSATANLLDGIPGTVFTTGDNVSKDGSLADFQNCYQPWWGRHRHRTRPSPGDRDYLTQGAAGYFAYFGTAAGAPGAGYYSYDLGDWHVVVLNSSIPMHAGSPQEQWLRADLAASNRQCTVAYWHHPRFSSLASPRADVEPLWKALYEAGAEIIINGHYRVYERFAPQTPAGTADAQYGIRQFIVGTGGQTPEQFNRVSPNSEVRKSGSYGVLELTLENGGYRWKFVPIRNQKFTDSGSGACHASPGGTPVPAPVARVVVTPPADTVMVGATTQLAATARDANGQPVSGVSMSWTSRDTLVAKVTAAGLVTGLSVGSTQVIAAGGGKADTAIIMVKSNGGGSGGGSGSAPPTNGFFAAPNGSSSGDGSLQRPWDLRTALSGGNGKVKPGHTIWLRGGTYRGTFVSTVSGTSSAPVTVRGYPGERAILDGAGSSSSGLRVRGQWSILRDFELMNSDPTRVFNSTSSHARTNTLVNEASNTKYINLVIHDGGVAFYSYEYTSNVEVYGCIFYNNGWEGSNRGHGHGIYVKSNAGPVYLRDNIIFNQFGYGIHAYTNAGSGGLNNIRIEGNVSFNNGTLSGHSASPNILFGGEEPGRGITVRNNLTYFSPGISGRNLQIGYSSYRNNDVSVQGNYAAGGSPVAEFGYWNSASVSSNTFIGSSYIVTLNDGATSNYSWGGNMHYRSPTANAWRFRGSSYTFSGWRGATGLGGSDQAMGASTPSKVFVKANTYEPGRATIVVYNWSGSGSVAANLSGILSAGDRYEVRNVQDLHGSPVASGMYSGGSISLPMSGVTPPKPVGMGSSRSPKTGPQFDVFIVRRL